MTVFRWLDNHHTMFRAFRKHVGGVVCAALALFLLVGTPFAYAAAPTPPDMLWVRTMLIDRYLQQFGYLQSPQSDSSVESPLLQNLNSLMVLYQLFRNSNDGLINPAGATVGDLMVLYELFYQ